jgi:RimJ/RimL family protein N-acetyltransferase
MPQAEGAIQIRALTLHDLPAYKALRDEALRTAPDAFTSDYESTQGRPAQDYASRLGASDSGHFVLGAFNATGNLLGRIALEREDRIKKRHCANVIGMMVGSAAQGQGIATQLVAQCVINAKTTSHLEQLVLTVTATNPHVVRLYERAGFVRYGLLPRAIKVGDAYYDKLHMRLDLRT